jgi:hypothetical protein
MPMSRRASPSRFASSGFTLVEMIVVTFLLALAMLGILAVFDASARINKSEQDLADAQGSVRFGVYQMTRSIRMAGAGGLYVTQAVLNHRDPQIGGITVVNSVQLDSFDNVELGTNVTNLTGTRVPVRPGTDMIEVRGVINSPLLAFDQTAANGCGTCTGSVPVTVKAVTGTLTTQAVNDDAPGTNRPQFAAIDAYTQGASGANPMLVIVAENDDLHNGCNAPNAQNPNPPEHYPQFPYNVGVITAPTTLVASQTFGTVNFANAVAKELNNEFPSAAGTNAIALTHWIRHAGVVDDILYFIDNTDPNHPALAQGVRRGAQFDVITLADDVEDMQIAYGVDTNADNTVGRLPAFPPVAGTDPDTNVSNQAAQDEWVPNLAGNDNPITGTAVPYVATDFVVNPAGAPSTHCVNLHGVMISLLAKSKNADPTYRAPTSQGIVLMNSPVTINAPWPDTAQYANSGKYRRRVQTLKINLRNFSFEG